MREFDNDVAARAQRQRALRGRLPGRMVIATDSHVVSPLFFPGGDIGCLSVHGTINDVAMSGAQAALPRGDVRARGRLPAGGPEAHRRVDGRGVARRGRAGRHRRHQGRRAGQGRRRVHHDHRHRRRARRRAHRRRPRPARATRSSSAARWATTASRSCRCARTCPSKRPSSRTPPRCTGSSRQWSAAVPGIHCLRDPTRGGLATTLNEIAAQSRLRHGHSRARSAGQAAGQRGVRVPRPRSALRRQRRQAGRDRRRARMPSGCSRRCARIRSVATRRSSARSIEDPHHFVQMETSFGGRRNVDWLTGEQLPRIC